MRGNKILVKAPRKNKNKKKTAAGKRDPFFFFLFFLLLSPSFFFFSPSFPRRLSITESRDARESGIYSRCKFRL